MRIQVQTWVENVYRFLQTVILQFWIRKGRAVGYARSRMGDDQYQTANLLTCLRFTEVVSLIMYAIRNVHISKPGCIKVTEKTPVSEYQTKYSDIDINGHVNSIKYIEHIL